MAGSRWEAGVDMHHPEACAEKHDSSCADELGTMDEFEKLVQATYFGVIDVLDMQLKPLPLAADGSPEKYVALSYGWENTANPQGRHITTRVNVMSRIQPMGLRKDWAVLPKTIQDAMLLVRAIGQRYLWVDSLCIVQDSTSSWELNAKAMHLIYGNAYFTICAADGDATTGLRAVRPILSVVRDYLMSTKSHRQHLSRSAAYLTPERLPMMAKDPIREAISNNISIKPQGFNSSNPTSSSDKAFGDLAEDDEKYKPLTARVVTGLD
ncbi:hypothetical protein FJTKL_09345 [Diaporthe vaccinii]|uniref:Heterokaryon incompatibility domain-containing protein n=2 Tax=Diaporthe vaccinii TaxID=105482 RepID=A0ABR4FCE8_9PEZI